MQGQNTSQQEQIKTLKGTVLNRKEVQVLYSQLKEVKTKGFVGFFLS